MNTPSDSLITFPCDFTIKVMGPNTPRFKENTYQTVLNHYPNTDLSRITHRSSRDQRYISFNIPVHADSQATLDQLYQALTALPEVKMVL